MNKWVKKHKHKQTNKQRDGQTNKRTSKQTNKQTTKQTHRQTNARTNGQTGKPTVKQTRRHQWMPRDATKAAEYAQWRNETHTRNKCQIRKRMQNKMKKKEKNARNALAYENVRYILQSCVETMQTTYGRRRTSPPANQRLQPTCVYLDPIKNTNKQTNVYSLAQT